MASADGFAGSFRGVLYDGTDSTFVVRDDASWRAFQGSITPDRFIVHDKSDVEREERHDPLRDGEHRDGFDWTKYSLVAVASQSRIERVFADEGGIWRVQHTTDMDMRHDRSYHAVLVPALPQDAVVEFERTGDEGDMMAFIEQRPMSFAPEMEEAAVAVAMPRRAMPPIEQRPVSYRPPHDLE